MEIIKIKINSSILSMILCLIIRLINIITQQFKKRSFNLKDNILVKLKNLKDRHLINMLKTIKNHQFFIITMEDKS